MAEKKKNSASTAVTPAKGGGKGKKASAGSSRSTKAEQVKKVNSEPGMAMQLAPYAIIILAVILSICLIAGDSAGVVGGGIRNILTGISGGAAFFLPVFLIVETFMWKSDKMYGVIRGKMTCYVVVFLMITTLFHVFGKGADGFGITEHYGNGSALIGGGVLGGVLGNLLVKGFGRVCAVILAVSVTALLGMYIFGLTPRGLWITVRYKLKMAQEKRQAKREERAAYEQDYIAKRNRLREEEYAAYLKAKQQEEREAKAKAKAERAAERAVKKAEASQNAVKNTEEIGVSDAAEAPSVYKVRRKKVEKAEFVNDYVDAAEDEIIPIHPDELEKCDEEEGAAPNQEAIDEKIFDEVMRRTQERLHKNRRTSELQPEVSMGADVPLVGESDEAPIILPPPADAVPVEEYTGDELAELQKNREGYELPFGDEAADFYKEETVDALKKADEYSYLSGYIDSLTENASGEKRVAPEEGIAEELLAENFDLDETDTVKLAQSMGDSTEVDLAGLFVNPGDAELLDKLSEAYIRTPAAPTSFALAIERSDVGEVPPEPTVPEVKKPPEYVFPPIDILTEDTDKPGENIREELQENAIKLVETLKCFNVKTKIEDISRGPTITRYELQPEPGTKVRSITNLVDDIALNLATTGVRIEAPIPGKAAVGIEVPNKKQFTVHLRTLIEMEAFQTAKSRLTVCLGENVAGEAVYFDIAKMPHLLIAGATGMGKSVCINSLITSILYKAKPDEVKLILIDPKKVELSIYNGIPHLIVPVVSEPKKAAGSLSWAVNEMERRFGLIEAVGVRDIKMFNEVTKNDPDYEFMPQIVIIIDELADLMMTAPDDVESSICRLAQKARAAGMHLIIGTQRPSVDVITGLIKANIPSRIAFTVSSQVDSRTIIDKAGAENLIGRGDMLFNPVGAQKPMRVQGAYVSETDVEEVVTYVKNMNAGNESYSNEVLAQIEQEAARCGMGKKGAQAAAAGSEGDGEEEDPMLRSAIELAVESGKISTSLIQRRLSLGYGRAAKLIDRMEQLGYVSAPDGSKPREVLISKQEFMEMVLKDEA